MKEFTQKTFNYLKELEEDLCCDIISDGEIVSFYSDTYFELSGHDSWDKYNYQVQIPTKYYKKINSRYTQEKKIIEDAIIEVARKEKSIANSIDWTFCTVQETPEIKKKTSQKKSSQNLIEKVWNDAVWSKVIARGIIGVLSILLLLLFGKSWYGVEESANLNNYKIIKSKNNYESVATIIAPDTTVSVSNFSKKKELYKSSIEFVLFNSTEYEKLNIYCDESFTKNVATLKNNSNFIPHSKEVSPHTNEEIIAISQPKSGEYKLILYSENKVHGLDKLLKFQFK